MDQPAYKVSELNEHIKDVLNSGFPATVWVCGEIQNYNRNRDKSHVFFELVEKDPNSQAITARIGLVIFAGKKFQIQSILKKSESPFDLKDDIEVKFACKVDFYAPHGAVRLVVESIDPFYTLGKLAQDRIKLITELKAKGILEKNKARDLPLVPLNIGLVTSDDSAAYNDFLSELAHSGFGFQIHLRNTLMQGKAAEADVSLAISQLSAFKHLDVIVVTRGGGSIADLACFDSRLIAEAIADCRLPVLTGIGHEINLSIADMAAHTQAKTPTAIAQFLAGRVREFVDHLNGEQERLFEQADHQISQMKERLKDQAQSLQNGTMAYLRAHREHLVRLAQTVQTRPVMVLKDRSRMLADLKSDMTRCIGKRLESDRKQLGHFQKMVQLASPVNTLKRGFTITRGADGKAIKKVDQVKKSDMMTTEFADGNVTSQVVNIK